MMKHVVVHPASQKLLDSFKADPPQALLISGQRGVGLLTIASWFAGKRLAGLLQPSDAREVIDIENGTISIEMIRRLYDQTRAKHTSPHVIIIDNADRMSRGAQNAFLKLLEEPGNQLHFLLTSHAPQNLLPTITSRAQHIAIQPLQKAQSDTFIDSLGIHDPTKRAQLQFIAEGLPAELTRLTKDETYFAKRAEIIGDARTFLQADTYTKLLLVQKYRADRTLALQLIDSALHILRRSVSAKPQANLVLQLRRLLEIEERIAANHNIPLQLTLFVL